MIKLIIIISVAACILLNPLSVDAARVKNIDRATKDVGDDDGHGHLVRIYNVTGWAIHIDESVDWDIDVKNTGPNDVRVVICKPFTTGPWQIVQRIEVAKTDGTEAVKAKTIHFDNNDVYFFIEYKSSDGKWVPFNGGQANSHNVLTNQNNAVNMFWTSPQAIIIVFVAH